jgi:hypothetical protein
LEKGEGSSFFEPPKGRVIKKYTKGGSHKIMLSLSILILIIEGGGNDIALQAHRDVHDISLLLITYAREI